jgi:hypothetical protein
VKDARAAERTRFARYARSLADRMALRDWTTTISSDLPCDPDALASVVCCEGRRHVTIRLSVEILESDPAEQRQIMCHELLHCHFAAAAKIAEKQLEEDQYEVFKLMLEYGIDAVAESWAAHLPLPGDDAKPTEASP